MSAQRVFEPALRTMNPGRWECREFPAFSEYLRTYGLPTADTAQRISVDSLETLSPELREAETMVLRLGQSPDGRGTRFALVATPGRLQDFFLIDDEIFAPGAPAPARFAADEEVLLPYSMLLKLTENMAVSLAFASGLIGHVLGLDPPPLTGAPVGGASTYSFEFRSDRGTYPLEHRQGQVEIDAMFVGHRNGRPVLFVCEFKMSSARSLAKHKLLYPVLAVAHRVTEGMQIVPVYVRVRRHGGRVIYDVVECACQDPREGPVCLTELEARAHRRLEIRLGRGNRSGDETEMDTVKYLLGGSMMSSETRIGQDWTREELIVTVFLYRFGWEDLGVTYKEIGRLMKRKPSTIVFRLANFLGHDGVESALEGGGQLAREVYEAFKGMPRDQLRREAIGALLALGGLR